MKGWGIYDILEMLALCGVYPAAALLCRRLRGIPEGRRPTGAAAGNRGYACGAGYPRCSCTGAGAGTGTGGDALVDVCTYLPGVYADLRYATENNFTGQVIYDFTQPQLRYGTLKKLAQAQEMLAERDLALKIWDAYRPVSAQFRLWEVCPDPQYVADPTKGYSGHSRGNTVDVTLVSADGSPVPMPTDFDDFTAMADRDYSDVSDTAAYDNVRLLEDTMVSCGFRPYSAEWWHFTDTTDYPVVEE